MLKNTVFEFEIFSQFINHVKPLGQVPSFLFLYEYSERQSFTVNLLILFLNDIYEDKLRYRNSIQ